MDIISHAIAGACTGAAFGEPIAGAIWGVLPDLVLGVRRRFHPTILYNITHSLTFIGLCGFIGVMVFGSWTPAFSLLSHIALDLPTHGTVWAPPLFYPFKRRYSLGKEWEWFSLSWGIGLAITIVWSSIWLLI
jgi:hypothetical protein